MLWWRTGDCDTREQGVVRERNFSQLRDFSALRLEETRRDVRQGRVREAALQGASATEQHGDYTLYTELTSNPHNKREIKHVEGNVYINLCNKYICIVHVNKRLFVWHSRDDFLFFFIAESWNYHGQFLNKQTKNKQTQRKSVCELIHIEEGG